jgi:hypothetical protein
MQHQLRPWEQRLIRQSTWVVVPLPDDGSPNLILNLTGLLTLTLCYLPHHQGSLRPMEGVVYFFGVCQL